MTVTARPDLDSVPLRTYDGTSAPLMQLPARLGKYELQQFLGGGMSHVYRAFDTIIGRTVAVKILTEEAARDAEARERFLDEARLAAKVTHDNVIAIYDFGADPQMGLFMVMEFLQGEDLRSAIKAGHLGDLQTKLKIGLQTARALEFIHTHRIIHRDIKPENIHLNPNGAVKLMDFGIARSEDFSRTQPGYAFGTPYYMAPEQVRGEKLTTQVDVYAFGILLYELLLGQKPFTGEKVDTIFYSILNVPLNTEPLTEAGIPAPVIALVAQCTAKQPAERPQGFTPVIAEIERLMGQGAAPARPAATARSAAAPVADEEPVEAKSSRGMLIGIVCAALVVAGAGAYFLVSKSGGETKPSQSTELTKTLTTSTGTMVLVPAGEFLVGQDKQRVSLPAYYIDQTEVTNAAYDQFCRATGHALPEGFKPLDQAPASASQMARAHDLHDLPVVNVTIGDAKEFAKWAGKRLPTAFEWEKAARGSDGRTFPWGEEEDVTRANVNTKELQIVSNFPKGASPCGALQMVGNVWELVDARRPPPSDVRAFQTLKPPARPDEPWYMIRGESAGEPLAKEVLWDSYGVPARWRNGFIGFRCVKEAK
jgi:formylglycine-generating enzyme required for sulfatase activity